MKKVKLSLVAIALSLVIAFAAACSGGGPGWIMNPADNPAGQIARFNERSGWEVINEVVDGNNGTVMAMNSSIDFTDLAALASLSNNTTVTIETAYIIWFENETLARETYDRARANEEEEIIEGLSTRTQLRRRGRIVIMWQRERGNWSVFRDSMGFGD